RGGHRQGRHDHGRLRLPSCRQPYRVVETAAVCSEQTGIRCVPAGCGASRVARCEGSEVERAFAIVKQMRVALLTREYPPEVYGGAGVHVEYLSRELSSRVNLGVHCCGKPRSEAEVAGSDEFWEGLSQKQGLHMPALRTLAVNLQMVAALDSAELAHTHTWYANFAGHLAKLISGIPH